MSDVSDLNRHTDTGGATATATALDPGSYEPPEILYAGEDRGRSLFIEYFRTLVRFRWLIAALGMAGIAVSFLLNFDVLPIYMSATSVNIQSLNSDFMNMKAASPTGDADGDSGSDTYVQTQIKLLQSDTLLERTVAKIKAEPHPDYIDQMDLASRMERRLHLVGAKKISYNNLVDDTAKRTVVKPLGITRLVQITCNSWSSDLAAHFCNTLVEQFGESDLEMRGAESQKTSKWLTQQVEDVRVKAEQSEKQLEAATGGNGLVLSPESTGVEEDKLRDMQTAYIQAEADRMQKQALAGIGSASSPGMTPELNQSNAYQTDAQKLADLQTQLAKLVPEFKEDYPPVIKLRQQIKEVQDQMSAERDNSANHLNSEYEASVHREQMLGAAYQREESTVSSDLGKASRISLLRGEVEAEQKLYQNLLQLAREAGFASAIHASTIRVVDAAEPAPIPFSPRRGSSAASGLLLGTLCGVGLAFIIERNTTVFRLPGDTERYLGLRELGVIPSSIRGRRIFADLPLGSLHPGDANRPREAQALSNWTENYSIVAEAYRSATTSIMLSEHPRERGRVYVVSSPNASEGKTTVISNLGVALSKSRLRVLLIDGDLRKPNLHKVLQVPNEFGFRNMLRGESRPESNTLDACYQPTSLPNLFVLPAGQGTEETVELLHSAQTAELIQRYRSEFDVVIIDTPPMLHMADTRILASHAQGAILVVRAGVTTRDEASKARDLFDQDRVRMVGTILNDFNPAKNGLSDYYKSYYRYMEEAVISADESVSWLDNLLARDRRVIQPVSDSGARNGKASARDFDDMAASAEAEQTQNDAAPSPRRATPIVTVHTPRRNKPRPSRSNGEGADAGVSGFLMKMFNRGALADHSHSDRSHAGPSMEDTAMEMPVLRDSVSDIYVERTEDRRRADRMNEPPLAAYYWDGGAPRAHEIRDVSPTGFYLLTDERWYPGTQVMILLQRTGDTEADPDRAITVNAQVVRFGVDGIGFELVQPEKKGPRGTDRNSSNGADRNEFYRFLQRLGHS